MAFNMMNMCIKYINKHINFARGSFIFNSSVIIIILYGALVLFYINDFYKTLLISNLKYN